MSHIIAIIEDEEPIRELYKLKLESEGFHVIVATNGKEGHKLLKKHNPHVLILDIMMPEMSGIELMAAARDEGVLPPSVVLLTNLPYDIAREMARPYPTSDIFIKLETTPVTVTNRVKELLSP